MAGYVGRNVHPLALPPGSNQDLRFSVRVYLVWDRPFDNAASDRRCDSPRHAGAVPERWPTKVSVGLVHGAPVVCPAEGIAAPRIESCRDMQRLQSVIKSVMRPHDSESGLDEADRFQDSAQPARTACDPLVVGDFLKYENDIVLLEPRINGNGESVLLQQADGLAPCHARDNVLGGCTLQTVQRDFSGL